MAALNPRDFGHRTAAAVGQADAAAVNAIAVRLASRITRLPAKAGLVGFDLPGFAVTVQLRKSRHWAGFS